MINYIKTPQQHELFENFQRLANRELPTNKQNILAPLKPVVTRWNSYCSAFERAVLLQPAINAYIGHYIRLTRDEDTYAISRGNKLPVAAPWMRSTGLSAADWGVVTEYLDVLTPLKLATKRLEGRGKGGQYGAIYEVIPVFEFLLGYYEQRVTSYNDVVYEYDEAPEDHLAINLRAAWAKASDYYTKLDASPAYYAATILHPYYKTYCDLAWADRPDWLEENNRAFYALWAQYKTHLTTARPVRVVTNDIDDAIDSLMEPNTKDLSASPGDLDEYQRWKQCEPRAEKGSNDANDPINYWLGLRDRYPQLSKLALDVISIPASSCDCERMFSELGDLLQPRRRGISAELLAAIQCVRRWQKAGFGPKDSSFLAGSDTEIDELYRLFEWDENVI